MFLVRVLIFLLLVNTVAWGQTGNTFVQGQPLTAAELNALAVNKQDYPVTTGALPTGTSVLDPGTGGLNAVVPVQTKIGTSYSYVEGDLFYRTRRSNSGTAMTDTLPPSTTVGMTNGTRIEIVNVDATAILSLSAGTGTTLPTSAGTLGPGRDLMLTYDLANTTWRVEANTSTAITSPASLYGVPTIASGACGTGSNGSISGTNLSGAITIGSASTTSCAISFSATLTSAPSACVIFPGNATAAAQGTTVAYVGSPSTTGWTITGSALASTIYRYVCL
jgi:hypothetical protein